MDLTKAGAAQISTSKKSTYSTRYNTQAQRVTQESLAHGVLCGNFNSLARLLCDYVSRVDLRSAFCE